MSKLFMEALAMGLARQSWGSSETGLLEKQSLDVTNAVDKRQDEGFNSLL